MWGGWEVNTSGRFCSDPQNNHPFFLGGVVGCCFGQGKNRVFLGGGDSSEVKFPVFSGEP